MAECVKIEKNKEKCSCTYNCSRRGNCCECIFYHKSRGELPGCMFPPEAEKNYDRSIEYFTEVHS